MSQEDSFHNLAQIREMLNATFDDVGLVAFIQDELPALCDSLARGQRKDEIVNLIIDYLRRHPEDVPRIVSTIQHRIPDPPAPSLAKERIRQRVVNLRPWDMVHAFKDRHQEIQDLTGYLRDDRVRLISIIGQGGMGKTALACYVLAGLEPHLEAVQVLETMQLDGILYFDAKSTKLDLERVYAGVEPMLDDPTAQTLANRWRFGEITPAARVRFLQEALQSGRYLILLDNLETALDDGEIREEGLSLFVHGCLARTSGAKLIVTSRQEIRLPPAALPSARIIPLEGLPEDDAIALLLELDPQGWLGLQDAARDTLRDSSQRLQGIPQALILLAGLLSEKRPFHLGTLLADEALIGEQIVDRLLDESFQRHLGNDERAVMQALAVFDRPADEQALLFLLQPWFPSLDLQSALGRLIRHQLLIVHHAPKAFQYSLHPLNQEYAYRQLPEDEQSALNRRALELQAAEHYVHQRKPQEQWQSIEDLAPQLAEFEHRMRAKDHDCAGLLLEAIDHKYLSMWGHASKLVEFRTRLLGRLTSRGLIANNLGNLGISYQALGQVKQAQGYFEQALAIVREIGERHSEGIWLGDLGKSLQDQGQVEEAIVHFEQALTIARETGNRAFEGVWLGDLGDAYHDLGQFEAAIDFYEKALVMHEQAGSLRRIGAESGNLGSTYRAQGYFEKAIALYSKAVRIALQLGDRWSQGANLGRLGVAYRHTGRLDQAQDHHQKALANAREIGHRRIEGRQLGFLGVLYRLLGETELAIQSLNEALAIARDTSDRRFQGGWLHRLSAAYHDLGDAEQAMRVINEALDITRQIRDRRGISYRLQQIGRLLLAAGQIEKAEAALLEAQELEAAEPHASVLLALGAIHLRQDAVQAWDTFSEAAEICRIMLDRTANLYEARFLLAAAMLGQAICDPGWTEAANQPVLLAPALAEYGRALDICAAPGVVQDAQRDLELFQAAGIEGLAPIFELLEDARKEP